MDKWHEIYWALQRARPKKYGGPGSAYVVAFVAGILCAAGLLWALYYAFTLPTVYESHTTGNCVRVDDVRGVYSCENMPRKYHHQWTQ